MSSRSKDVRAAPPSDVALPKRTLVERSGMSVNASPLERGLPGSHRVDDHADGLDHDLRVVDHDVVSRVRVGDVHRARHERRELVLGRRVRSVDDRSEVRRRVRRQLTGPDELRDDIDELVAGREHDDRHGPWRCRGGRLVEWACWSWRKAGYGWRIRLTRSWLLGGSTVTLCLTLPVLT